MAVRSHSAGWVPPLSPSLVVDIAVGISLAVIALVLVTAIAASLLVDRRHG
jgi:hypothetical protein